MFSCGINHVLRSQSMSSHLPSLNDLLRVAVSMESSRARRTTGLPPVCR